MTTSLLQYARFADSVVLLQEGEITEMGPYEDLVQYGGAVSKLVGSYLEPDNDIIAGNSAGSQDNGGAGGPGVGVKGPERGWVEPGVWRGLWRDVAEVVERRGGSLGGIDRGVWWEFWWVVLSLGMEMGRTGVLLCLCIWLM